MNVETLSYVLITPARNEEALIEKTIQSVVGQTVLPRKWIIVSDGSTDRTEEIVQRYCSVYPFMQLVTSDGDNKRNFGSKVKAFNAGYAEIGESVYAFIGNLDADVTFPPDYYAKVMREFEQEKQLGLAGGIIQELIGERYVNQTISTDSVAGAVQFFRRECFEKIGGYLPLTYGGIDAAAEIMVRMHGWQVKTFFEHPVLHHRRVAQGNSTILKARYRQGIMYYKLGYHPLFQLLRSLKHIQGRPYFFGSLTMLCGYCSALCRNQPFDLPNDVVNYLRREQLHRLKEKIARNR